MTENTLQGTMDIRIGETSFLMHWDTANGADLPTSEVTGAAAKMSGRIQSAGMRIMMNVFRGLSKMTCVIFSPDGKNIHVDIEVEVPAVVQDGMRLALEAAQVEMERIGREFATGFSMQRADPLNGVGKPEDLQ